MCRATLSGRSSGHPWKYLNSLFRPENTHKGLLFAVQQDLNKLYWTQEKSKVSVECVEGKCQVAYTEDLNTTVERYTRQGPDRFYFSEVCVEFLLLWCEFVAVETCSVLWVVEMERFVCFLGRLTTSRQRNSKNHQKKRAPRPKERCDYFHFGELRAVSILTSLRLFCLCAKCQD